MWLVQHKHLLVKAARVPLPDTVSDYEARCKLLVTVVTKAAQAPRGAIDMRNFAENIRLPAMAAIGVDPDWDCSVQDLYMWTAFQLCREALWALDPALSHDLLTAVRL